MKYCFKGNSLNLSEKQVFQLIQNCTALSYSYSCPTIFKKYKAIKYVTSHFLSVIWLFQG